jgi:hypothetical protein
MYQARGEATWRNVLWADDNQTAVYTLLSTLVAKTVTDVRTAIDEQDSIATDVAALADSRLQAVYDEFAEMISEMFLLVFYSMTCHVGIQVWGH